MFDTLTIRDARPILWLKRAFVVKLRLKGNELGFFDPRKRYGTDSVTFTPEMLSKFEPGAARLRSVAVGRHQWFRLPPPTVREFDVVIQKQSGG